MRRRAIPLALCAIAASPLVISFIAQNRPIVLWNASASVPKGLYRLAGNAAIQRGDLVAIQPPPTLARWLAVRRALPLHTPLLKHVAALSPQIVCRFDGEIWIGGRAVAIARTYDRYGRPLPAWRGCHAVPYGDVFLLNAAADSLDSRYFQSIPLSGLLGRAQPLWLLSASHIPTSKPAPTQQPKGDVP
jgi:conjugative transfer signal peptidase TraF